MSPIDQARRYVAKIPGAIAGSGGHDQTYTVATALVHGFALSEFDAWQLLQEYNSTCQPPWNKSELRHKLQSAINPTSPHQKNRGYLLTIKSLNYDRGNRNSQPSSIGGQFAPAKPATAAKRYPTVKMKLPEPIADGTRKLLETCFGENDGVCIVAATLKEQTDGTFKEEPDGYGLTMPNSKWLKKLDQHNGNPNGIFKSSDKCGIYIRINAMDVNGKGNDKDVISFRHVLVEFDKLDIDEQYGLIVTSNLPCAAIISSGGKSVHAWINVNAQNFEQWRERKDFIYAYLSANGIDPKNKNPSRLSRLPNCERFSKRQELLALNIGAANWDEWIEQQQESPLPEIVCASDFIERDIQKPPQVIHGILYQGAKMVVGGASKSMKTWNLLGLALAISAGKPWLSFPTTPGRVLFVNFELFDFDWQDRIKAASLNRNDINLDNLDLLNLRGFAASFEILLPQLLAQLKNKKYILIIFDPTYKLYAEGTDENSAKDIAMLLNAFERFCVKTGAALAYAAHFSKGNQSSKNSTDRMSGSGVFSRDPDAIITLTDLQEEKTFRVDITLRSFAPVEGFAVRWKYPAFEIDQTIDANELKEPENRGRKKSVPDDDVYKLLPSEGLSAKDFEKLACSKLNISSRTFASIRAALKKDDRILLSKIDNKWKPIVKEDVEPF